MLVGKVLKAVMVVPKFIGIYSRGDFAFLKFLAH
jgi:hypothetical protein